MFNVRRHNAETYTFCHCIFLGSDKFPVRDNMVLVLIMKTASDEYLHIAGQAHICDHSACHSTISSCYKVLYMKTSHPPIKDLSITQSVEGATLI
jgi:hypothetical protein